MTATVPVATKRWLFGPAPDLLLGCGLAYGLVFALRCVRGSAFRGLFAPGLLPLLSMDGGTPHDGATLLRVYGEIHGVLPSANYAPIQDPGSYRFPTLGLYAMCLVSGAALWAFRASFFRGPLEPRLGRASVFMMVLAVANIHHFILDGAIWKLRDGRVARVLLRAATPAPPALGAPLRRRWFRLGFGVVGGTLAATTLLTVMIGELGFRRSRTSEDFAAARSSLSALAFFGRDDAVQHGQLAEAAFARGELALAAEQYEASLSRGPTPQGWLGPAQVAEQRDLWQKAAEAYAAAAQLDPAPALLLHKAGVAWRRAADPARGVPLPEKAVALEPDNKLLRCVLDRARRDASHPAGTAARGTF